MNCLHKGTFMHLNYQGTLEECMQLSKPGGYLLLGLLHLFIYTLFHGRQLVTTYEPEFISQQLCVLH
jgi:hypothetical protein